MAHAFAPVPEPLPVSTRLAPSTLVVLPTYEEADNIDTVLRRVRDAAPHAHVLVVDDASPDGTAALADEVARELGAISVLRRPAPAGLGSAYRDGFRWGLARGYDVLVEMDSDLSHDPAVLPVLLRRLDAGADLVIGSRYVPGGIAADWPWPRRMISRLGCRYAQVMLRLDTRDATSGYRADRADALARRSISTPCAPTGTASRWRWRTASRAAGGKVREIPIEFRDRRAGRSKMSSDIVVEALWLVTKWGVRDRLMRRGRTPARR